MSDWQAKADEWILQWGVYCTGADTWMGGPYGGRDANWWWHTGHKYALPLEEAEALRIAELINKRSAYHSFEARVIPRD